jgi:hypothetical protein
LVNEINLYYDARSKNIKILPQTINTHLSVLKYKEVLNDKITGVLEEAAASTLSDSKPFLNASYQSGITARRLSLSSTWLREIKISNFYRFKFILV